jgi:hypothetical protein
MPRKRKTQPDPRRRLVEEVTRLAQLAIFGSISETYRTCGNAGCRCHRKEGPKHGPHAYVSYRGPAGKTTGYYVPQAALEAVRNGVAAWQTLQERLRKLAELNKDRALGREEERK